MLILVLPKRHSIIKNQTRNSFKNDDRRTRYSTKLIPHKGMVLDIGNTCSNRSPISITGYAINKKNVKLNA